MIDYNKKLTNYKFGSKLDITIFNGLRVIIVPKKGFSKYVCSLSVNFGSLITEFNDRRTNKIVKTPNGTAHFLEHKMFEQFDQNNEIIDITEIFGQMGIDANAYTDFNCTNYYIKGSSYFYEGLSLFLDNMFNPCFNSETIEKEKGIILQEAKSYSDDPKEKISIKLFENVYNEIPYFIDVVGKEEDILKISNDDLYSCYDTFYHPSNMALYIVGDIDINKTMEIILDKSHYRYFDKYNDNFNIQIKENNEIKNVNKKYEELKLDINIPIVRIMIKLQNEILDKAYFNDLVKAEICMKIFLDLLIGSLSDNYQLMLDKELIASGFMTNVRCDLESSNITIGCNSLKPIEFKDFIMNEFKNINSFLINEEYFLAAKRNLLGSLVYVFNDVEGLLFTSVDMLYKNEDLFNVIDKLDSITIEDVNYFKKLINEDIISVLIAKSK